MSDVLNRLLGAPDLVKDLPTKQVELPRLSTPDEPFVLTLRALPWSKAQQLRQLDGDDAQLQVIIASCDDLDRLDASMQDAKSGIMTLEDVLRHKLLPGEITRLVMAIDALNGYRGDYIREVKN